VILLQLKCRKNGADVGSTSLKLMLVFLVELIDFEREHCLSALKPHVKRDLF
jgi:hypothetical protein